MKYTVYLKGGDEPKQIRVMDCDEWKHTSQGFVVLYDKVSPSGQIIRPNEEREPKIFIPRENILYIIPKED